jgi:hypothetical protein
MQPMATFDPEKPCRVHDRLKDRTIEWAHRLGGGLQARCPGCQRRHRVIRRADPRRVDHSLGQERLTAVVNSLLELAATSRDLAKQARKLAEGTHDYLSRVRLERYATVLEVAALDLEKTAAWPN